MNAVEIADAVSDLFAQEYDPREFPFAFLEAFGIKGTTVKRLRTGNNNASDVPDGVLLRSNIHLATCETGAVGETLKALRENPQTAKAKAKFILATDGEELRAEDRRTEESFAMAYRDFPAHFGAFLELGGISTVKEIKDNPIDIRATGRLNKLYVELLNSNPEWQAEAKRPDLNHFFARLIFCFFAEDTGIFHGEGLFTKTVDRMTESDGSNVHEVLETLFRAMNTSLEARKGATGRGGGVVPPSPVSSAEPGNTGDGARSSPLPVAPLPLWAEPFPYVNGGLFSGNPETPRFTKIARAYLRSAGELNWTEINPDIFGSMIQAVADDEERGALGMHYTSVPNILKVLNPLFLDELRAQLEAAGDSPIKLLNLRKRIAHIRVFDPACGSGNFLVIAYKQMREIEARVNELRGEKDRPSEIPLTNFRGIEIRDFAAEVARLALIIAEYQADERYRGKRLALAEFLPLKKENWIWRGNALRLDWTTVCPPTGDVVKVRADNLFEDRLEQTEMDFANAGGETYLCGNPPYKGSQDQSVEQKADLRAVFTEHKINPGALDYVSGWFWKATLYMRVTNAKTAFVSTNSICQGRQVETLWEPIFRLGQQIAFAYTSFKWANLASHKAGVTVVIMGLSDSPGKTRCLYMTSRDQTVSVRESENINAYLVPLPNVIVGSRSTALSEVNSMQFGSMPNDGGNLLCEPNEARCAVNEHGVDPRYIRSVWGSNEYIKGKERRCVWVSFDDYPTARENAWLDARFQATRTARMKSDRETTRSLADVPYRFGEVRHRAGDSSIILPRTSSESREFLPGGLLPAEHIITSEAYALSDAPLWNLALIASRLHLVWIATVCGKLKTDYRYSNTLGWNTFPVPTLTQGEKDELTRCAEEILLARERHFPATIADLYDPEAMPDDLRRAHERNDETLERIYIGRRFKNDTERLEKLFEMYTAMVAKGDKEQGTGQRGRRRKPKETADESLL